MKNPFGWKWTDQVEIVGPGCSSKSNIRQIHHGAGLEPPIKPKHKGSDCKDEKSQVAHACSVILKKQNEEFANSSGADNSEEYIQLVVSHMSP